MRRATIILALGLILAMLPAMAIAGGDGSVNTGTLPDGCIKFDSDVVGQAPISATVDGVTVTIINWHDKAGEDGEYVGFDYTYSTNGYFDYFSVKSGKDIDDYEIDTAWAHSNSWSNELTGNVKAISNVVFCYPHVVPDEEEPEF